MKYGSLPLPSNKIPSQPTLPPAAPFFFVSLARLTSVDLSLSFLHYPVHRNCTSFNLASGSPCQQYGSQQCAQSTAVFSSHQAQLPKVGAERPTFVEKAAHKEIVHTPQAAALLRWRTHSTFSNHLHFCLSQGLICWEEKARVLLEIFSLLVYQGVLSQVVLVR